MFAGVLARPLRTSTINIPVTIYLFQVNDWITGERCKICSKLTIKHQGDVIDIVLMFLWLTLNIFHTFF